jgi:hypothetical protein
MDKPKLIDVSFLSGPVPFGMVEVVWDDAAADTGWEGVKPAKDELVLTVGFLTHVGDNHIIVASTICDGEFNTNCRLQIPIGMIKHIRELE